MNEEANTYHQHQLKLEKAFRAQLGWRWHKVEKELRKRKLSFQDIDKMVKELGVTA